MSSELQARAPQALNRGQDLSNIWPFLRIIRPTTLNKIPLRASDEGRRRSSRFLAVMQFDDDLGVRADIMVWYAT